MKINHKLLPMKMHYFLLMAGTAPLVPLIPVYMVTNLSMSYSALGLIYTVLPFTGLLAKSLSGTIADCLHAHRKIFLGSIFMCALGFLSIYFCQPMPLENSTYNASVTVDCSSSSYIRYDILHQCGRSNKIQSKGSSTCQIMCKTSPTVVEYVCQSWNISSGCNGDTLRFSAFTNFTHADQEKSTMFFPIENVTISGKKIGHPMCDQITHINNCSAKCDSSSLMEFFQAPLQVPLYGYKQIFSTHQFWIFFFCVILYYSGFGISVVMSDTICFQLLGQEFHLYGKQRMWGSIGWGLFAIITGFLIDWNSGTGTDKNYTTAFILSICVLSVDFVTATRLQVKGKEKNEVQTSSVLKVLMDIRVILFILCCTVIGVSTGVLWTYELVLVRTVAYAWDCHFAHLRLLQGIVMGVQCFFGELPFFFISGKIIQKIGHVHSMTVAIAFFGLRFILFNTVTNPWYFLPIELLGGPTFGLFYAVMTSYANLIAPSGAHATLQGLCGASFEGLGVAIGAFAGGALFNVMPGGRAFMYFGIFNTVFALCHLLLQIMLDKIKPMSSLEMHQSAGYEAPKDASDDAEYSEDLIG